MKSLLCLATVLLIVGCRNAEPRNPHPRREDTAAIGSSVACVHSDLWWRQPYTSDPATHTEWDSCVPRNAECDETDADLRHFEQHHFRAPEKSLEPAPMPEPLTPPSEGNLEEI